MQLGEGVNAMASVLEELAVLNLELPVRCSASLDTTGGTWYAILPQASGTVCRLLDCTGHWPRLIWQLDLLWMYPHLIHSSILALSRANRLRNDRDNIVSSVVS